MAKQERRLLDNLNASASHLQYRYNPAEYERKQPHTQVNHNTDDTWIIMLCILVTIGFLALLAKTTLCSIL
ncbi:MAG: hypothetical protein ACYSU3_24400 [Planctomycetota bacterium]|jgi:hypothetical protein